MTSNLHDYRSSGIKQHSFLDEQVNKLGSSHDWKIAFVSLSYPYAVKYDMFLLCTEHLKIGFPKCVP